jgi:hypothetical protein
MKAFLEILSQARPEIDELGLAALPDSAGEALLEAGFLQPIEM